MKTSNAAAATLLLLLQLLVATTNVHAQVSCTGKELTVDDVEDLDDKVSQCLKDLPISATDEQELECCTKNNVGSSLGCACSDDVKRVISSNSVFGPNYCDVSSSAIGLSCTKKPVTKPQTCDEGLVNAFTGAFNKLVLEANGCFSDARQTRSSTGKCCKILERDGVSLNCVCIPKTLLGRIQINPSIKKCKINKKLEC